MFTGLTVWLSGAGHSSSAEVGALRQPEGLGMTPGSERQTAEPADGDPVVTPPDSEYQPQGESPTSTVHLTDREMEILQYLPTRLSTIEIAECLTISPNTVKTHLKSIYNKLAVRSRNEAILQGTRYHLIATNSKWLVTH